jgi:hypothetical protein
MSWMQTEERTGNAARSTDASLQLRAQFVDRALGEG